MSDKAVCEQLDTLIRLRSSRQIDTQEFRRSIDSLTGAERCIAKRLTESYETQDWSTFERLVFVASRHPSTRYTRTLCSALDARSDQYSSEYVAEALGESRDEAAIECLERALWWHRDYDEFHGLAIKCIWALAWINTSRSRTVMARAAQLSPALISEWAMSDGRGPTLPERQIRASFDRESITIYQAFSPEIADIALSRGRLAAPFSFERTTWIKPSFLWMMYRSGWATKSSQERVLAIRVRRDSLDAALVTACLTSYDSGIHADYEEWQEQSRSSAIKVQWDPDRTIRSDRLPWRCIQIGIAPPVVAKYANDWIVGIEDVTPLVRALHDAHQNDRVDTVHHLFPDELPYPIPAETAARLGMRPGD